MSPAKKIVEVATKHVGSKAWAFAVEKGDFKKNTYKCNLFVYEVAEEAKCEPLPTVPKYVVLSRPPLAKEWADPNTKIKGWEVVKDPKPGDVAALAFDSENATGHVAIVIGAKETVSAAKEAVVKNDWGFRDNQNPTFRRFTGKIG